MGELARSFHDMTLQLTSSLQALQEQEERLKVFLNSVPIGVAVYNYLGDLVLLNYAGQEILGSDLLTNISLSNQQNFDHFYNLKTQETYPLKKLPFMEVLQGQSLVINYLEVHRYQGQVIPQLDVLQFLKEKQVKLNML